MAHARIVSGLISLFTLSHLLSPTTTFPHQNSPLVHFQISTANVLPVLFSLWLLTISCHSKASFLYSSAFFPTTTQFSQSFSLSSFCARL